MVSGVSGLGFKGLAVTLLVFFGCPVVSLNVGILTDLSEKSVGVFFGGVLLYWMKVSVEVFKVMIQG